LEKHIPYYSIKIEPMRKEHLRPCIALWTEQFKHARATVQDIPERWITDSTTITLFLREHVETGKSIVARANGDVVGYMVYDRFSFHGADTGYCPIMGHASVEPGKPRIYEKMYECLSGLWVKETVLDHMVTFFAPDMQLRKALFHLGFGLYAVDAFRSAEPADSDGSVSILRASPDDVEDVMKLVEESRLFYRRPPLFLVRGKGERRTYEDFIGSREAAVFIAEHDGRTVGFMGIKRNDCDDAFTLADKGTGTMGGLGVYIQPSCRGRGVGARLLSHVVEWCREQRIDRIHVDYESANSYASGFWPKHFTPAMYSVRRRVNPDILNG